MRVLQRKKNINFAATVIKFNLVVQVSLDIAIIQKDQFRTVRGRPRTRCSDGVQGQESHFPPLWSRWCLSDGDSYTGNEQ